VFLSEATEYNPLDYTNLTKSVVDELMRRGPYPLAPSSPFRGAGVYALFYNGDFEPYQPLRSPDADLPIYVGKAVPPGARKGGGRAPMARSTALFSRLAEHAASIQAARNLNLEDFACRFLVVTPLWITMAERFLIEHYLPIWNTCIEGFGLHDPGAGRHQGVISWWDALHPGRPWAARLRQTRDFNAAVRRLQHCLEGLRLPSHVPDVEPVTEDEGATFTGEES
jgi:hypothetical protein